MVHDTHTRRSEISELFTHQLMFHVGLLQFHYFRFRFGFWLKTAVSVFHGFRFSIQKMSIALHITFAEIHQMDNIVMFIRKLAVYVMQLLHIKTQKVNLLDDDDDDDISCRPLL